MVIFFIHWNWANISAGLSSARALIKGNTPPKDYGLGKGLNKVRPCTWRGDDGIKSRVFFSQMAASFLIESTVYFLFFGCDVVQDMKLNIHQVIYTSVWESQLFLGLAQLLVAQLLPNHRKKWIPALHEIQAGPLDCRSCAECEEMGLKREEAGLWCR